jgi:hypothetical protein
VAHACNLAAQEAEIKRIKVQSHPWANSSRDPISKNPSQKSVGGVAQVKALSSNSSIAKKKKKVTDVMDLIPSEG